MRRRPSGFLHPEDERSWAAKKGFGGVIGRSLAENFICKSRPMAAAGTPPGRLKLISRGRPQATRIASSIRLFSTPKRQLPSEPRPRGPDGRITRSSGRQARDSGRGDPGRPGGQAWARGSHACCPGPGPLEQRAGPRGPISGVHRTQCQFGPGSRTAVLSPRWARGVAYSSHVAPALSPPATPKGRPGPCRI